jgi:hypothetical protein
MPQRYYLRLYVTPAPSCGLLPTGTVAVTFQYGCTATAVMIFGHLRVIGS